MSGRFLAAGVLTLLAVVWAGWLAATPFMAGTSSNSARLMAVAATYRVGSIICHQHSDRSFHVNGVQTPVCARCLGLYGGAAIGALVGLGWGRRRLGRRDHVRVHLTMLRTILLAAAVPTVALWLLEHAAGLGISNLGRFAGAVPLGAAVAWFVVALAAGVPFDDTSARAIH